MVRKPKHFMKPHSPPTDSDLSVPVATSDSAPNASQPQLSTRRRSRARDSLPRGRRTGPPPAKAARVRKKTQKGKGKALNPRDAVSEGPLSPTPPMMRNLLRQPPHESEDLAQLSDSEAKGEPLPRASLSPSPAPAGRWFYDHDYGLHYSYPPENLADPNWYDRMMHHIETDNKKFERQITNFRHQMNCRLSEVMLAEADVDQQLEDYQDLLQDIMKLTGAPFVEALGARVGCWKIGEDEEGMIEVAYSPHDSDETGVPAAQPATLTGRDGQDDLEIPSTPSSPAPVSPSHAASVRVNKRPREQPLPPRPLKRPRFLPSSRGPTRIRDSSLPPSSPVDSVRHSPQSSPHRLSDDVIPGLPTDPPSAQDTEPNTSLLGPLAPSPKASGYIRDHSFHAEDHDIDDGKEKTIATGSTAEVEPIPAEPQKSVRRMINPHTGQPFTPRAYDKYMWPSYISPTESQYNWSFNWSPNRDKTGEGSSVRQDDDISNAVVQRKASESALDSPYRDMNTNTKRAAARAALPPPTSEEKDRARGIVAEKVPMNWQMQWNFG